MAPLSGNLMDNYSQKYQLSTDFVNAQLFGKSHTDIGSTQGENVWYVF